MIENLKGENSEVEESLEERILYLKILVEGILYKQIKEDKGRKDEIIDEFIEKLPDSLKNIKNCRKIIIETLAKQEETLQENKNVKFSSIREEERYGGKLPPPMLMRKNQDTKQLIDKDEEEI